MKTPLSWLAEYADAGLSAPALAERLAMTGTEVDRVLHHGVGAPDAFVVGRVEAVEPHPDADRLRVCRVDVGTGESAQIVCGAPNVAAGQTVAVARPGAVMPDGTKLKAAKLRGVRSEGMILAEDELAIGTDHAGILVLDGAAGGTPPGTPLAALLAVADDVLDLEITPNRPDCLGIYGVAREVHAATGAELKPPPWAEDVGSEGAVADAEVVVECPDLCPRFTARVFEDVTIGPSPPWLKARLTAAGMRPISNVVDITNYTMLLTGQPLHAFDLDRVAGGRLVVRRAEAGEAVDTLDGQTRTLDADMVLIADDDGPTSIAGVMGGARSEVGADTTRVLLEVANWNGPNINRTSTRLNLRSEASGRYEKGLQPEQAMEGQRVGTRLMLELTGARLAPGTIDVAATAVPGTSVALRLRDARVGGLLGLEVPRSTSQRILVALGFGVAEADDGLDVTVPYWRRDDVTREADLIEEIARLDGLEKLPATLPARTARGALGSELTRHRRAADALRDRGMDEIVGWSFTGPDLADRLRLGGDDPRRRSVRIDNPMSEDAVLLRTTLLGGLLDAARHNLARGATRLALFEQGAVYLERTAGDDSADAAAGLPRERRHLAGLLVGPVRPPAWADSEPPPAGFFAAKGIVEALLRVLRVDAPWEAIGEPFLHPGRTARVGELGIVGELHPAVAAAWDLPGGAMFELDLDALPDPGPETFRALPQQPAVRQDLAVVVHDDVTAARVLAVARAASPLVAQAGVFDAYRGEGIGAGRTSLALHLEFRAPERTLTEAEASVEREKIVAALKGELGAELRG